VVVAIDGPAGTGKSTVAKYVADSLGFLYVNSGALYRAITWKVLDQADDPNNTEQIIRVAHDMDVYVDAGAVRVEGAPAERVLYSHTVNAWVSRHSAVPEVRDCVNDRLRELSAERDVVVEGRDITTVVFPNAEVKVYLDASVETRARRRYEQGLTDESLEDIQAGIESRDARDREKHAGALRRSADAVFVDTSGLTIDEVCEKVLDTIQRQQYIQELQGNHE
jgi:cytidylate kinase